MKAYRVAVKSLIRRKAFLKNILDQLFKARILKHV